MIPDDVRPLLQSLLNRSQRREVEWLAASSAGGHGDYVVLFPSSSLVLEDDPDNSRIEGRILNQRGDTALTFWASYREADTDDYTLLEQLLEAARRKVLKADEALAEIRTALEGTARVGETPKSRPAQPAPADEDDEDVPF